jgi:hypothetical protein
MQACLPGVSVYMSTNATIHGLIAYVPIISPIVDVRVGYIQISMPLAEVFYYDGLGRELTRLNVRIHEDAGVLAIVSCYNSAHILHVHTAEMQRARLLMTPGHHRFSLSATMSIMRIVEGTYISI